MKRESFHVSMVPEILKRAHAICAARGLRFPTELVSVLVREEFERKELELPPESAVSSTSRGPSLDTEHTMVEKVKQLAKSPRLGNRKS